MQILITTDDESAFSRQRGFQERVIGAIAAAHGRTANADKLRYGIDFGQKPKPCVTLDVTIKLRPHQAGGEFSHGGFGENQHRPRAFQIIQRQGRSTA